MHAEDSGSVSRFVADGCLRCGFSPPAESASTWVALPRSDLEPDGIFVSTGIILPLEARLPFQQHTTN